MKQEIDWKKEILESGRFNSKFEKNLLENGAKGYMQGIYLGYMYSRWRKIRGLDKNDPKENKGQMQSSLGKFFRGIKKMKWSVKLFISGTVVEDIVVAPNMDSARETVKRRNAAEARVISVNAKI